MTKLPDRFRSIASLGALAAELSGAPSAPGVVACSGRVDGEAVNSAVSGSG